MNDTRQDFHRLKDLQRRSCHQIRLKNMHPVVLDGLEVGKTQPAFKAPFSLFAVFVQHDNDLGVLPDHFLHAESRIERERLLQHVDPAGLTNYRAKERISSGHDQRSRSDDKKDLRFAKSGKLFF